MKGLHHRWRGWELLPDPGPRCQDDWAAFRGSLSQRCWLEKRQNFEKLSRSAMDLQMVFCSLLQLLAEKGRRKRRARLLARL